MIVDGNLRAEALSALLGNKITSTDGGNLQNAAATLSVQKFHMKVILGKKTSFDGGAAGKFSIDGKSFSGPVYCKNPSEVDGSEEEFFIDEKDFFDPGYDFDFTNLSDSAACMRGNEPYARPNGWYRMALKVRGKYPDGDTWLGSGGWRSDSAPGEWPVSYHGTGLEGARGIISCHNKAGPRQVYGRGVYSTPQLSVAEGYCKTFKSKSTGKTYKVIVQNRIKPEKRQIHGNYWLIPVPEGTSAEEEKRIIESSIRPYGVLIKEI